MDNVDLTNLLKDWPFESGNVNVRLIRASDGRPLIQLRVDLGILQMEMEGRPDGATPHGFASMLDYHLHEIELAEAAAEAAETGDSVDAAVEEKGDNSEPVAAPDADEADSDGEAPTEGNPGEAEGSFDNDEDGAGGGGGLADPDEDEDEEEAGDAGDEDGESEEEEERIYVIDEDECRAIREEAVQFYHRYIGLYALDEFDAVFADASHNLALIDLCRHYGATEDDREAMEQLRLHTMMTRTRAHAASVAANGKSSEAVEAIDHGLAEIEVLLESVGVSEEDYGSIGEVQLLQGMRDKLIPKLPGSQKMELRERLKAALSAENYELAAILRDEIRMMKD